MAPGIGHLIDNSRTVHVVIFDNVAAINSPSDASLIIASSAHRTLLVFVSLRENTLHSPTFCLPGAHAENRAIDIKCELR